jgi:hypothetical protein
LDRNAIIQVLQSEGFALFHATKKLSEYRRASESIYLKNAGTDHPVVIHGRYAPRIAALSSMGGVQRTKAVSKAYHNSNMRSFDLRQNTGRKPTRYGFDFGFTDVAGMRMFLGSL